MMIDQEHDKKILDAITECPNKYPVYLAKYLNNTGIRTRRGLRWSAGNVSQFLKRKQPADIKQENQQEKLPNRLIKEVINNKAITAVQKIDILRVFVNG